MAVQISAVAYRSSYRNNSLAGRELPLPKATSTATSIHPCPFRDEIVLGAETRATGDTTVAGTNCKKTPRPKLHSKIHYTTESIRCCSAEPAADTEFTTAPIPSNMEFHALQTARKPRVVTTTTTPTQMLFSFDLYFRIHFMLFMSGKYRHQGYTGADLVLRGTDSPGPRFFTIHSHGSSDNLANGFRKLDCNGCIRKWLGTRHRKEARNIVKAAIAAGIFKDLDSGSDIEGCIITSTHTEMLKNVEMPNERVQKERHYNFRRGTTARKKKHVKKFAEDDQVTLTGDDDMDTPHSSLAKPHIMGTAPF
ncbi:hypothetical protein CVT26_011177 [Gymnopilus dilepis]|uniref:Proteasome beta subunit C-terminal domain-containing protein n=1 Tax=Gymnopilus dilepis TaxID=231916 RepID=A0A409VJN0_9AGAR|nr:hypothetical protein CVT26_011177 [Gymnopilus dilepis]